MGSLARPLARPLARRLATPLGLVSEARSPRPPRNAVAPSLSGSNLIGGTLTCSPGTWTGDAPISYAYQWQRAGVPIAGATGNTYTLAYPDDDAVAITCAVAATNAVGSATAVSNSVTTEDYTIPVNTAAPAITGTAAFGAVLTCSTGTWEANPSPAYAYQWRRNGVSISGATASTYTLAYPADNGASITCAVIATNVVGSVVAVSGAVAAPTYVAPSNTAAPSISRTGAVLTANAGTWTGNPAPSYAYQWTRNGTNIAGATAGTYTIPDADLGANFGLIVTASNAAGSASATAPIVYLGAADVIAAAAAGYSLNRLTTAYTGPAIRVRRSSDNAEADIGFNADGTLNTTALLAHCGSGSGFVTTWYDQSGNGRDVTQATASNQPRIVNAGVVDTLNGRPAVFFNGVAYHLFRAGAFLYAQGSATINVVVVSPTPGGDRRLVSESFGGGPVNTTQIYAPVQSSSSVASTLSAFIRNDAGVPMFNGALATNAFTATPTVLTVNDGGDALTRFVNGSGGAPSAYVRDGTLTLDRFAIGALVRASLASAFSGSVAEVVIGPMYADADRQTLERNQGARYGIAVA